MNKSDLKKIKNAMDNTITSAETVVVIQDSKTGEYEYTEEQQQRLKNGADVIKISFYDKGLL